jgi:hypothetical protein
MEKIIRDVLIDYMEENGFFTKHQHGFRKGRSCATQLIEVMEKWTEDLDKKNSIDVIYLDFQKAFDTVPYKPFRSSALHLFSVCISPLSSMML